MSFHQEQPPLSKAEMLRRIVGRSAEYDREDIEFWRNTTEAARGQTLYRLLARGKAMRASGVPVLIDDSERLVLSPGRIEVQRKP